ncbi:MAG: DUF4292 domain-containing protein [Prevotella sp.]|jgi:hypothetical protein|nr:DUF4292 domain-containing protein [Prevotella sp.]MCI1282225.1 DUF4292 domain-containing protein [Prevotella sp.]
MNKSILKISMVCLALLLASCGAKKAMVNTSNGVAVSTPKAAQSEELQKLSYMQKVSDRQLYQKNVVADMSFSIKAGSLDHTVPGSIHMRKDEVIRLQLFIPLLGSEIGRLEFTPDYVLIIDRLHKEYIKSSYSELDFLKENGLTFYSLQALFWNQLLVPGTQKVSESDLKDFDADLHTAGQTVPVTLRNGKMTYQWNTDKNDGKILSAIVDYLSDQHGKSNLTWNYSDFTPLGVKFFPATQSFTFSTTAGKKAQTGTVTLNMDGVTTDSNWETQSTISPKYKKVEAKDVFSKLLNM